MQRFFARIRLNYGQKLFLVATLPLILTALAISVVVTLQSRQLAEREIETLEAQLIARNSRITSPSPAPPL